MKILLIIAIAFLLSACGKRDSPEPYEYPEEPPVEPAPTPPDPKPIPAPPQPQPQPVPPGEPAPTIPVPSPPSSPGAQIPDIRPALVPCPDPETRQIGRVFLKGCSESRRLLIVLNGTNATCRFYGRVIETGVAKGYWVACPESKNTGNGEDGLAAYHAAIESGIDVKYVLVSGHSQGGVGAVATAWILQKAFPKLEVDTMAVMPAFFMNRDFPKYASELVGQKLVICGRWDFVVPCMGVWRGYAALQEPKQFTTIYNGHFSPQRAWAGWLDLFD